MTYESFGFLPYGGTKCKIFFLFVIPAPACNALRSNAGREAGIQKF
jgi:hypothetical protein